MSSQYATFESRENRTRDALVKLKYSTYSAIIFLIVSSPATYQFTQKLLGKIFKLASPSGTPTANGLITHTFVFLLVLFGMMHLKI